MSMDQPADGTTPDTKVAPPSTPAPAKKAKPAPKKKAPAKKAAPKGKNRPKPGKSPSPKVPKSGKTKKPERSIGHKGPQENAADPKPARERGLPDGWCRNTYIIRKEFFEKIEALAYERRMQQKEVLDQLLEKALSKLRVKPLPPKKESLFG